MEQEGGADQHDDDEFLPQLVPQIFDGAKNEAGPVVGGHDLHARRQAAAKIVQLLLDRVDGRQRVLAPAHDDDAADGLALAVEFADAPAKLRPHADLRHVLEQHGHAAGTGLERDGPKIVDALDIPGRPDHVFGFRQFDHRAAGLLVAPLDRLADPLQGQAVGPERVGIDHHLVLPNHAADGRHLRHAGHRLQLVLQEPVLKRPQLADVVSARPVDQGILIDPADPGGVGAERRQRAGRQARRDLAEILEHPAPRPVKIGPLLEQHIDV